MRNGENWTEKTYKEAEALIGYKFKDRELLLTCFTHSTYANNCGGESNERLEWLGDAVLELFVTDALYRAEGGTQGEMTDLRQKYVSEEALTPISEALGLMSLLRHSGGEQNLKGKPASDLFEAVVGALYLDGGYQAAKRFLDRHLTVHKK